MNILGKSRLLTAGNQGENARLPIHGAPGVGEFMVTIGLGTPKVDLTLIFDTGSTWTQCVAFGNKKFSFSSQSQQSTPPRTIRDSGTTITRLPPPVYSAVRAEFIKYMSNYPVAQNLSKLLDTCYDLQGQKNLSMPKMVLQFEKTKLSLDPSAVVW
ncbi:hypothetical protein NL676_037769 [Syzygium grande]|nr:hypothetical protein NL676_037769 [Syzygium grande]